MKELKIIFVGIPDMALICLNNLLLNKFDIAGVVPPKKNHETYSFFKSFVSERGLNLIEFDESPNEKATLTKIARLNADIGVVCSYDNLLSEDFLKTTKMGYINCHPSLLPDYRGANPYFHIINNGEKTSGITLHFMDKTFDTGDIIYQEKMELMPFETMGSLFNRTTYMISDALIKVLSDIKKGVKIKRIKQKKGDFKIAPRTGGNFRIRWKTNSVFEIECLIRACNPFYNAYTDFRGVNFKIIKAEAINYSHNFEFGRIIKADEDNLIIAAKDGALSVQVMQLGTWGYFRTKDFYYMFSPNSNEYFI